MSDLVPLAESQKICGWTVDDLAQTMADLFPIGMVWPRDPDSIHNRAIHGWAAEFARVMGRDCDLLAESYPCGATETLSDWERIAGLPDPCTGPLPTIQQRQAAVCGQLAATGGASEAYFINLAQMLGFDIHIETFRPFRASRSRAGDPVCSEAWAYVWRIDVLGGTTIVYFRASRSAAGEPLATWGNKLLECALGRYAPAHTRLIWAYEPPQEATAHVSR